MLEALYVTGRLGLARRDGNRRYYDLTERLFPADLLNTRVPEREQLRHKLLSRYRGHGLLGAGGSGELWPGTGSAALRGELRNELVDRGELATVAVEGLRGDRFVIGDELPLLAQAEREIAAETARAARRVAGSATAGCAFLAPLDPLMWDRSALGPLYGFDYRWEVYTPAAKRRWGYYVLPILFGDRLVGRIEPRIDRGAKVVRVLQPRPGRPASTPRCARIRRPRSPTRCDAYLRVRRSRLPGRRDGRSAPRALPRLAPGPSRPGPVLASDARRHSTGVSPHRLSRGPPSGSARTVRSTRSPTVRTSAGRKS